ncbi:hypothetical protein SprV_0602221000 [Sparganum proliferum]
MDLRAGIVEKGLRLDHRWRPQAASNIRFRVNPSSNRPERKTALVAGELAHHKMDIATFSDIRLYQQGQLEEVGAGYTFLWTGRPKAARRDTGVAFAIQKHIVERLPVCRRASTIV